MYQGYAVAFPRTDGPRSHARREESLLPRSHPLHSAPAPRWGAGVGG